MCGGEHGAHKPFFSRPRVMWRTYVLLAPRALFYFQTTRGGIPCRPQNGHCIFKTTHKVVNRDISGSVAFSFLKTTSRVVNKAGHRKGLPLIFPNHLSVVNVYPRDFPVHKPPIRWRTTTADRRKAEISKPPGWWWMPCSAFFKTTCMVVYKH